MTPDPLDQLDYYELLGVAQCASSDDVRVAFHRFAQRYHPDNYVGHEAVHRDRAAQIFRRGTEAYRVLMNVETRRSYDLGLARGDKRYRGNATGGGSPTRPPASSLAAIHGKARPFLAKALEAMRQNDLAGARLSLRLAMQYDPGNQALLEKLAEIESRLGKT